VTFIIRDDAVWSTNWNWAGSLLAATCKDRQIRVIDPRAGSVAAQGKGHEGLKQSKVTWMGRHERLLTTGFDKMNMRQFAIWDARDLTKPITMKSLGSSSGVSMPLYDADTDVFFIASKGESAIRVYEASPEGTGTSAYQELSVASSDQLCRGACLMPKRCLELMSNEIDRVLKVTNNAVIPTGFFVPRARRIFHEDLFPDTHADTPAIEVAEWLSGENMTPSSPSSVLLRRNLSPSLSLSLSLHLQSLNLHSRKKNLLLQLMMLLMLLLLLRSRRRPHLHRQRRLLLLQSQRRQARTLFVTPSSATSMASLSCATLIWKSCASTPTVDVLSVLTRRTLPSHGRALVVVSLS